jgi:hypothetical protein
VNDVQIARLVRRIARTLETEMDCGECSRLSPQYVDALLDGQDGLAHWPLLQAHLEQCPVCAQEFVTLREVARMDLDGTWPTTATLLDWACRSESSA